MCADSPQILNASAQLCTGFDPALDNRWQPHLFTEPGSESTRRINVLKLHGSATWKRDGDGNPVDTRWPMPTEHDCLLFFGYKSVPESEPFAHIHNLLKEALLRCDVAIVVGFRFGDPYIRELFDFGLRANQNLRMICCARKQPDGSSHLANILQTFKGRAVLLQTKPGELVSFGDPRFETALESHLTGELFGAASV
jgi:hypothetical protein